LVLCWAGAADADTFDFSTLNAGLTTSAPHLPACPCSDQVSGTQIFSLSGGQVNPWTIGSGARLATINFNGGGQGNNAGKVYAAEAGVPSFALPTTGSETTLGTHQGLNTGDFAQANGFPLYFWFSSPVALLNAISLADVSSTTLTILGYSGLANQGGTLLDSLTIVSTIGTTGQKITLNWTNIGAIYIVDSSTGTCFAGHACDSGFYVNDVEVNDPTVTPLPAALPLFATGLGALGLLGWRRKRRARSMGA
jgi:hypothetical protein